MGRRQLGVWFIGALGSVATTTVMGCMALRRGIFPPTGMSTAAALFSPLGLVDPDDLVFGGMDIRRESFTEALKRVPLGLTGLDPSQQTSLIEETACWEENICRGTTINCGEAVRHLDDATEVNRTLREEIAFIRAALQNFRQKYNLQHVVVVNLASTEPLLDPCPCHNSLSGLEECLDRNEVSAIRAGTLYAYAAIQESCSFINFTPSNSALLPAIIEMAETQGVPVMGNDGKTGETLVKSALAPMFSCRNLEVLSWPGFNILGNMDGQILHHPGNKKTKITSKDRTLAKTLGYCPHSQVSIDYVPSLGDQKTAWDFIHFKGFMNVTMSMQFIWQGYDSILAAPLVLDLVRMAEFAKRQGEAGLMPQLAVFFKSPHGVDEYRLYEQNRMLLDYVSTSSPSGGVL